MKASIGRGMVENMKLKFTDFIRARTLGLYLEKCQRWHTDISSDPRVAVCIFNPQAKKQVELQKFFSEEKHLGVAIRLVLKVLELGNTMLKKLMTGHVGEGFLLDIYDQISTSKVKT